MRIIDSERETAARHDVFAAVKSRKGLQWFLQRGFKLCALELLRERLQPLTCTDGRHIQITINFEF